MSIPPPQPLPAQTTPMPEDEAKGRSEGVGRRVGGGMTWMTISAVLTRITTFAAQILMGHWLEPADFALYATATSIAGFMMVCRDFATGNIIVQRGRENYEHNAGPAFWLGLTYDMVVFIVIVAAAYPLATTVYHDRQLAPMLIVLAMTLPFGAIAGVLYSRLRLELRFKAYSWIITLAGFLRQVSMIVFAKCGLGAMSFAWPALVCILVDVAALLWFTRDAVWMRPARIKEWGSWMRDAVWLMFTSLANFAMDYGPYLVLGPILGAASKVTGYYFFAYQITAQIGIVLAYNATLVLTPALQRLNAEPRRQCEAAMRTLRTLMLAGSVASVGLAAIMAPLEHLLWNGKYAQSVGAVMIFGAFYPWRITFGLTTSLLTAQGAFRRLAVLSAVECIGLMVAAALAGFYSPTATGIAWWTGCWVMVSRVGVTVYVLARMQEPIGNILRAMFPAWLLCLAALGATAAVSSNLGVREVVLRLAERMHFAAGSKVAERGADVVEIVVYGCVCSLVMLVLARVILHADLRDVLRVAPGRFGSPLARVLRLDLREPQAPLP